MENAPTALVTAPPPLLFPPPPSSVDQITVLAAPPPPPFPGTTSSLDLSPLEFILAIVAVVTIPALIYTFIFAFRCPPRRRHLDETSGTPSVVSELSHHDTNDDSVAISDVTYRKEDHAKEIGGECPVCLSTFGDGEEVRQLSVCRHSFHASCIDMWLSNHSNCPICRATIAAKVPNSSAPNRDRDPQQQGNNDASALV